MPLDGSKQPNEKPRRVNAFNFIPFQPFRHVTFEALARGVINGLTSVKSQKSSISTKEAPLLSLDGSKQPYEKPRRVTAFNFIPFQPFRSVTFGALARGVINRPTHVKSQKSSVSTKEAPLLPLDGSKQPYEKPRRVTAFIFIPVSLLEPWPGGS